MRPRVYPWGAIKKAFILNSRAWRNPRDRISQVWHNTIKEGKEVAKVKKKRITWVGADGSGIVGYKFYWADNSGVDYEADCAEVGNVTEVILPDTIPSFPLVDGEMQIGVTAINEAGNESDMAKYTATFQFSAPEAPRDLKVETVEDAVDVTTSSETAEESVSQPTQQESWGSYGSSYES